MPTLSHGPREQTLTSIKVWNDFQKTRASDLNDALRRAEQTAIVVVVQIEVRI